MKRAGWTILAATVLVSPATAAIAPGLKVGYNSAAIRTDFDFERSGGELQKAGGRMAGASVRVGGARFALQPELLYTQKGYRIDETGSSGTLDIRYVEVPVLARVELAPSARMRPYLVAGPALAFRLATKLVVETAGQKFEVTEVGGRDLDEDVSPTDFGAAAGAGVALSLGGIAVELEAAIRAGSRTST